MATSAIEWTDETWNPVTGCDKVSPGCAHCYAEVIAERFWATQYPRIEMMKPESGDSHTRPREFTDVLTHADRLAQPFGWRKPRRVFVNSMSDLFHDSVPDEFIDQVFAVMSLSEKHTFQVLTKRAQRMRDYMQSRPKDTVYLEMAVIRNESTDGHYRVDWPPKNVWLGVSVENQHFADERIPKLVDTLAAVRFVSYEPALGPVLFPRLESLDWIIVGGESGAGARPFEVAWARSAVDQCRAWGVSCFIKQLGADPRQRVVYGPATFEADQAVHLEPLYLKSRKGGKPDEWPEDLRVREFPTR